MKIRKAQIPDSKSICELFKDTLQKINIADYSQEEIEAWKTAATPEKVEERIQDKKRYMCIAENNNEIISIGTLKGNIITAVYVKSDMVGKGIGSSILTHLENVARKRGCTELSLDSSLTAVKFYKNHGYEKVRNSVHQVGDVELSCVIMKKKL